MSHLNKRGKMRSMRHKSNKRMRKHKRSLKHTRRMSRGRRMRMQTRRRHSVRHRRRNPRSYGYGYGYGRGMGRTFRGGSGLRSLLPTELVNLGDNISHGISSVAHDFVGSVYNPPSPMPHLGHQIDRNNEFILPKVADVSKIYNDASARVSSLYS